MTDSKTNDALGGASLSPESIERVGIARSIGLRVRAERRSAALERGRRATDKQYGDRGMTDAGASTPSPRPPRRPRHSSPSNP